jgi:regulator of protease activity HflC (stomatin/prohibitin superfamily)
MGPFTILIVTVVFLFIFFSKSIRIVREQEVVIIERLGKYHSSLTSGFNIVFPVLDSPRGVPWRDIRGNYRINETIDLRETVFDFPSQRVITRDNVVLEINAIIYFQVTDPVKAVYEIANLPDAIEKLTQTSLRNVIGDLDLDGTLTSRDHINTQLRLVLDEATNKWGVKVNRVEIQDIIPPQDIRNAMEKQMRAERDKRAALLEAEASKISAILKAEGARDAEIARAQGDKQARILDAEGQAEARLRLAKAESDSITALAQSVGSPELGLNYLIAVKYIDAFTKLSQGQANTVFMPYESSALLGSLGGVREMLSKMDKSIVK